MRALSRYLAVALTAAHALACPAPLPARDDPSSTASLAPASTATTAPGPNVPGTADPSSGGNDGDDNDGDNDGGGSPSAAACFPYGSASLPKDYSKPDASREDWWCPQSTAYGFQGFSYPLEDGDCGAYSNSFEAMDADFAAMKRDFGASIVRLYYPACAEPSVFENALKAGVKNDMAVIPQVWFNFGDGDIWKQSQQALIDVLESAEYGPVAPYVFHSADFGSEPVGDGVDGGAEQFVRDLGAFRAAMNRHGIPAGFSDDWDRPGSIADSSGGGLGDLGRRLRDASDFCHAHVMPFYHGDPAVDEAWDYVRGQVEWLGAAVGLPTFITETQWAWGENEHYGGKRDVGVEQYARYWKRFDDNCELFREHNVGWFIHAWSGESTFDMRREDGSYVIPDWRPQKC